MENETEFIGLKELIAAIRRNPQKVLDSGRTFLSKGITTYKRAIIRNPWRMGGSGGGAPVSNDPRYSRRHQLQRSGNLRDTHQTEINGLQAKIYPTAKYAPYVHGIEGWPRKRSYQLRPWLDYAKKTQAGVIQELYRVMLREITEDLAK